ncbi:MAG: site-specific DNA-methyltransferase [Candidatus Eremiobacteraeota bacterium]|nr:site-specific DNA-methyltransferase [Candidatus Eremiobacteraeota bacterium]
MNHISDITNKIFTGDCRNVLPEFPSESIDMVLTSPPYWKLRDYHHENQIGWEKNADEYIENLSKVFQQIHRILKPTGSLWINMSDQYENKSLLCLPWRLMLNLKSKGWILRNTCIWHKPNAMPASVKDRLNQNYEFLFHLVKSRKYYYNLNEVRTPHLTRKRFMDNAKITKRNLEIKNVSRETFHQNPKRQPGHPDSHAFHPNGKNPGAIISIPTNHTAGIHPATYPEELCRIPILASSPPGGIVLDPFSGIGTTLFTAKKLGRRYVGIEKNAQYVQNSICKLYGLSA